MIPRPRISAEAHQEFLHEACPRSSGDRCRHRIRRPGGFDSALRSRSQPRRLQQRRAGLHARADGRLGTGLLGRQARRQHAPLHHRSAGRPGQHGDGQSGRSGRRRPLRAVCGAVVSLCRPGLLPHVERQYAPGLSVADGRRGAAHAARRRSPDLCGCRGTLSDPAVLAWTHRQSAVGRLHQRGEALRELGLCRRRAIPRRPSLCRHQARQFQRLLLRAPEHQGFRRDAGGATVVPVVGPRRGAGRNAVRRSRGSREGRRVRRQPGWRVVAADGRRAADDHGGPVVQAGHVRSAPQGRRHATFRTSGRSSFRHLAATRMGCRASRCRSSRSAELPTRRLRSPRPKRDSPS